MWSSTVQSLDSHSIRCSGRSVLSMSKCLAEEKLSVVDNMMNQVVRGLLQLEGITLRMLQAERRTALMVLESVNLMIWPDSLRWHWCMIAVARGWLETSRTSVLICEHMSSIFLIDWLQKLWFLHLCVADGNRVVEEELVPFATSRKSNDADDFDDLLQIARERQSQR